MLKTLLFVPALMLSVNAFAGEQCPKPAKATRQAKIDVLMKASRSGYKDIRISTGCGFVQVDAVKGGQKARLWYDAQTLALVKAEPAN